MSRLTYFTFFLCCCCTAAFFPSNCTAQQNSGGPNGLNIGNPSMVVISSMSGMANGPHFEMMAPPAANLDQYRNGPFDNPDNSCSNWVNGNAGSQNSHFVEGWSVPYRCVMTDLPLNTSITITFGYDIKHSDRHALDYLTRYDWLEPHAVCNHMTAECLTPTAGVSGISGTTTTFAFPAPNSTNSPVAGQPTTSFNNHPGGTYMTLFGGTITNIAYLTEGDLAANQSETTINVTFTVNGATAVFAWGGHIASRLDGGMLQEYRVQRATSAAPLIICG